MVFIHPGTAARASGGGGSPIVTIFPTTASPGTQINVQGFNYPANVTVKVFFQTISNGVVTVVTDQGGFFFTPLTIPSTYVPGTKYFVHVNSSTLSVKVLFTFTKPSISIFGEYGPKPAFGSLAQVSGSGFAANETVDLTFDLGVLGKKKFGVASSDNNGSFFTTLNMPSIPFGIQAHLIATGLISGVSASTPVNEIPANGTFNVTITAPGGLVAGQTSFVQAIDDQTGASNQVKFFAV